MGNCMEASATRRGVVQEALTDRRREAAGGFGDDAGFGKGGGLKIKLVLTRAELDWLLLQLKEKGERSLEEVIGEIEKGRREKGRSEGWKPSLESIVEGPEVQNLDVAT